MLQNNTITGRVKIHYEMIRDNQNEIIDKLNLHMGFYTFRQISKIKEYEVMYDTADNHLFSVGIILSKQIYENKVFIKIRKVSKVQSLLKKPVIKFEIKNPKKDISPSSFAVEVAQNIQQFFSNSFMIDLSDLIKKVVPKIEIKTKGDVYEIVSGTGFKGEMIFQRLRYKDLNTKRKIKSQEVAIAYENDEKYKKEQQDIKEGIEKYCKELLPYNETRFEIAKNYLKIRPPKPKDVKVKEDKKEE